TTFGEDYPLPGWREVRLPPATLRGMDRTQIMVLRAAAALPTPVQAALDTAGDTTGVVIGHLGPTRRAVHHALRCYLGDVDRALAGCPDHSARERDDALDRLGHEVRALVPAATEDSFPGIMPNIIASRLASDRNFRGLAVTVDGGPDSALDALRTAERYLRHGDLDFAVVGAVNGNSTEELRRVLESAGESDTPAEGAFLVVLARESTARSHALPALARLRTRFGAADPSGAPRQHPPLAGSGRTYLGADPLVALVAHLSRGGGTTTISSQAGMGPRLDVTSPNPPAPPPVPAPDTEPAATGGPTPRAPLTRVTCQLDVAPPRRVRRPLPALPGGSLVVCSHADLVPSSALPADATVVVAPRPAPAGDQPTTEALAGLLPETRTFDHVRVLVRVGATDAPPADLSTLDQLRATHDLAFLAARRWRGRPNSSYAVLLADALGGDALHPGTGPFTGLVKALAREIPRATAFAVATDSRDPVAALDLLALESARAHDLAVVAHSAGRRREYRLPPP
ncbi:beta-ketoacyl synthase N-terminal-like domain-containing protein, partial [Actinoalloteichus caeruleus]|uniref:beta-ketoacyl synthase N-terminal-like domain-containing protein n=1 Tax=Actinoalloteichus cyanogriseus TaxID=2893586 RepID=UPI0022B7FD72